MNEFKYNNKQNSDEQIKALQEYQQTIARMLRQGCKPGDYRKLEQLYKASCLVLENKLS